MSRRMPGLCIYNINIAIIRIKRMGWIMRLKLTVIVLLIASVLFVSCAPVTPPDVLTTVEPTVPPTDLSYFAVATEGPGVTTSAEQTVPPDELLFDLYTANMLIPVIAAIMESSMLNYGGSDTFPPQPITDDAAFDFLYTYAQANTHVDGVGATLSDYEVSELLDVAYGDTYSYESFEDAAEDMSVTWEDGIWNFGDGETYAPVITYSDDVDVPLDENTEYRYAYTAVFDDLTGDILVKVAPRDNSYGVTITQIVIDN